MLKFVFVNSVIHLNSQNLRGLKIHGQQGIFFQIFKSHEGKKRAFPY